MLLDLRKEDLVELNAFGKSLFRRPRPLHTFIVGVREESRGIALQDRGQKMACAVPIVQKGIDPSAKGCLAVGQAFQPGTIGGVDPRILEKPHGGGAPNSGPAGKRPRGLPRKLPSDSIITNGTTSSRPPVNSAVCSDVDNAMKRPYWPSARPATVKTDLPRSKINWTSIHRVKAPATNEAIT